MNSLLLYNSLVVGIITTIASLFIGFVVALWISGLPAGWRSVCLAAAVVALALPPFLVTNCWLHYFGITGVWHRWLPINIFSTAGTIWILTLLFWPVGLFFVWGAWQRLQPAHIESEPLARGWPLIRFLLFPLARPAMGQAALILLVLALNNFAVPAILQVKVFPAEMWVRFNTTFDTWGALKQSWPLLLGPLALLTWFTNREVSWPRRQELVPPALFRRQLGLGWFWAGGACSLFVIVCSVFLPMFEIVSVSRTWTELPGALEAGQRALYNSIIYSVAGASIVMAIALWRVNSSANFAGAGKGGSRPRTGFLRGICGSANGVAYALAWLAFLLPGVLLGIGLIHAFNHSWTAAFYTSAGIVILAYAVRYLALGIYAAGYAAQSMDRSLADVARLEGATKRQMMRFVVWPQIRRPVSVAWYVLFLLCLWDVETIVLVVPPGGETLSLRIFNLLHYGHNAQVNALCFLLVIVGLLPLFTSQVVGWSSSLVRGWGRAGRRAGLLAACLLAGVLLSSCSRPQGGANLHSKIFDAVEVIGSRGVGVGQLNKPRSVAVDLADNVYVVDMTGRVQKFSSNGVFLLSWQMPQIERGRPKGMCHDSQGNVFVVEPHYSRVNIFSPTGKLLAQWGSHGTNDGELSMPRGVAVDSRGDIFVSEYEEAERVQVYRFDDPLAAASGTRKPRWIGGFGRAGNGPGEFNRPEGVSVDSQDRIYVADSCNHRIEVFSSGGKFLRAYGKPGKGLGELSYPYDICVDKAGRQYVCEFGNSRVQVFDADDQPIEVIGGPGAEPGRFSNPWGVAVDSAGNLYVADSQNHRLQKLVRKK